MFIYYNPILPPCKSITGGIRVGEPVQLNLYLTKNRENSFENGVFVAENFEKPTSDAFLFIKKDGEDFTKIPMQITDFGWSVRLEIAETGLYFYAFYCFNTFIGCGNKNIGEPFKNLSNEFLLTVSTKDYETPKWFKGGVMYQIFPDRFCKVGENPYEEGKIYRTDWGGVPSFRKNDYGKVLNNDFFGGNFKGIISKLPYLKELGITTIYLNPIFEANSNHRYDTANYMETDATLGSKEVFKELVESAEKLGIRILLDGVFNHTGDNSLYFNKYGKYNSWGAYQSKNSPYADWYSFDEFPNRYKSWWGIDILPEINENSPSYQEYIFGKKGVLQHWLGYGIGGYRLDVADELPDFFLKKLRKSVKEKNLNAVIIGEVWEDASDKVAYDTRRAYLQGEELDSVMNYPLKDAIIGYVLSKNADILSKCVSNLIDHYPKATLDSLMNILDTHDTARILTVLGGKKCKNKEEMAQKAYVLSPNERNEAVEKLKIATVLQFTLPGVPCIYYGDEIGMQGDIDPFCRGCFEWNNMDDELLSHYKKLTKIREENGQIFSEGSFREIFIQNGFYAFARENASEQIVVMINLSDKEYNFCCKQFTDLYSKTTESNEIAIFPKSFKILKISGIKIL